MTRLALTSVMVCGALMSFTSTHAFAQGDAASHDPVIAYGRSFAQPGTFWLDNNSDREVIRYTTPRDVRLCLPEPTGVPAPGAPNNGTADRSYPLMVTWDQTNKVELFPGNCLYFDARRVSVKPATDLPKGVTLRGQVEAERAFQP